MRREEEEAVPVPAGSSVEGISGGEVTAVEVQEWSAAVRKSVFFKVK